MTRMKLAITSAAVFALLAGTEQISLAVQGPGMGPNRGYAANHYGARAHLMGPGAQLDLLTARLKLSEEQRIKLLPILDEQHAKMKAVRDDGSLTRDQRRAKMEELRTVYHERMNTILTPDQKVKAEQMKAAAAERSKMRKDTMKKGPGGNVHPMDPAVRLERMSSCLGLTADQKSKIAPILDEHFKEMKALRGDAKLTRDQRMQKMQDMRVKYQDKIGALLTSEQKSKFGQAGRCGWDGSPMKHGPMMQDKKPATPPAK